ncbi:hypothetical protein F4604DRAFT_1573452 [Suillus subluteus]|nr:hypothetical protein F4604DRAFT_1573452 [Suillus subluteus]
MSVIPPASAMNSVLQLMLANEVSLWDLVKTVLSTPRPSYQPIKDSLEQHGVDICCLLFSSVGCREIVFGWAFETVVGVLCEEMVNLSSESNGLDFKASKTTSTQLEDSFMRTLALKIKKVSPNVFKMLLALLDANPGHRRKFSMVDITEMLQEYEEGVQEDKEMDLGEFGGDDSAAIDESDSNKRKRENDEGKARKRQRQAGERNAALMIIVRDTSQITTCRFELTY